MSIFDRIKKAFSVPSPYAPEHAADDSEPARKGGAALPDGRHILAHESGARTTPTELDLMRKITDWKLRPAAFQALWDGDTHGWGLNLEVVHQVEGAYTSNGLVFLRFGGDARLFTGAVPPWPEAEVGMQLGKALARHYGVPFFFPSPREPDDNCPSWWEQDKAIHCEDCNKLIIPTDSPYLPNEVCYRCHLKREADENLRKDVPADPDGVTILLGQGDNFEQLVYASKPEYLIIADFALRGLGRDEEASNTGHIFLEGADLEPLEAHIDARAKALLQNFKPDTTRERVARPEARCTVTYEGRTFELDLQLDRGASEIASLISMLEAVRRASKEHLRIWLVFRRGMTHRGDRVIRTLRRHNALATVEQLVKEVENVLDEASVRATVQRLEHLGHVRCSGDEVRLTEKGKYV